MVPREFDVLTSVVTQGERRVCCRQPVPSATMYAKSSPNEGRLGLAARVSEIQDEREIAVVDGDPGDVDDASDALLGAVSLTIEYRSSRPTFDSSESWNIAAR